MARLSLSLLGPFQVTLDGQPVTAFKSNKVRALLAYLAVEADRPHRREVLAGLLWPDWPDRSALSNLRYDLSHLRQVIGDRTAEPPFLLISRDTLQFNAASDYQLDVATFTDLARREDPSSLEQALALYRGSFLEGFSVGDSPGFEEWALLTRERLGRQMSSALHRLAGSYEERGEYERAQSYAWRQVELEPWDEAAHQRLMRTLVLGGQRSAALAQYESCRRLLAEELGVEPAKETTRLYELIRDGELATPVPLPTHLPAHTAGPPSFLEVGGPLEVERPVFVARERELAQLERFLEQALAGRGRVVFVTGEAGSGKTALVQEFSRRAREAHADLIAASGNCNAHTGIGDPYLPFREILELLTGDVQARWAAGAISREHARLLWNTLPLAAQALVEVGPDLIDTFVAGPALVDRVTACSSGGADWLGRLEEIMQRKATAPALRSPQRSDLFEQYTEVLWLLAGKRPLLLVLDDLQWADGGSISLLFHLGRRTGGSRILIVGTYRSAEVALGRAASPWLEGSAEGGLETAGGRDSPARERHPLQQIVNEFKRTFGGIEVDLERAEGWPLVDAFLDSEPNRLAEGFRDMLFRQTRGHPLFTVELLRGMQERGDLVKDSEGHWVEGPALDWETLPARVEAAIAERIGRLAQPLQAALRVASVQGEDFTAEVLAGVLGADERQTVQLLSSELDRRHRLVRAQALERMGSRRLSRYRFRHYLCQRYLYDNLDPVERSYLHEDVGNVLQGLYGEQASEVAVELARHFQEAGIPEKAIHYLHQAGARAVRMSAYGEAIAHLSPGLALLLALPDAGSADRRLERAEQELALQLALGMAWQGAKGGQAPEWKEALTRARDLSQQTGNMSRLCQVLGELAVYHFVGAEHQTARDFAEEALQVAQCVQDPLFVALGHWYLGFVLFSLGEYASARAHLEEVLAFYDPHQHHRSIVFLRGSDAGASALAYHACCLWCLGYPEQALERSQEAVALARELAHPFSLADVLCYAGCMFHAMRRDGPALQDDAEELMRLSKEVLPAWWGTGASFRGEALVNLGQVQEGMAQIREGMAAFRSLGGRCNFTGTLRSLAEAQARAGQPEEGLDTLAEALALVAETGERHSEAELYRVQAELLLLQRDEAGAEASLLTAIEVARRQQAKSWELRATTSLTRLWQAQDRTEEARRMLAEVYGWFTEGFDTPDLQEAKALLDALG
jgi:DNA-binding SARP family transcriptional activator/predicted ATPase